MNDDGSTTVSGRVPPAEAVVVAAGASRRMAGRDKLLSIVGGRPLVAWSLAAVAAAPTVGRIVLVVPADRVSDYAAAGWLPAKVAAVIAGGARRQESVAAGVLRLDALAGGLDPSARVVLIHDGGRPLASPGLVDAVATAAAVHGAAIPVLAVAETIKRIDGERIVETVDRSSLATAQTPQGVRRDILAAAWAVHPPGAGPTYTDEAALLEACRIPVHAIPGEPDNLKVTLPADLDRVAATLRRVEPGVGLGRDWHPFGPGSPLRLGGIEIDHAPRLHGHSDGDVALHAVADALLGAAGLGDLGRLFPADDRTPRGADSSDLLVDVVRRLAGVGSRPRSVDLTIVAGRPRLDIHLPLIRDRLATLLGVDPGAVNVKASSGNLSGPEGAGRGIGAEAVATVGPA